MMMEYDHAIAYYLPYRLVRLAFHTATNLIILHSIWYLYYRRDPFFR